MEVTHIGTTHVKVSRIHVLVSQNEMFKMAEEELMKDLVYRFIVITNQLMLLGKTFDNANLVHKVLRSLIEEWHAKVTTIKESLKMGIPIIQELYGNLEEHELELKRYKRNGDDKSKKSLAFKASNSFDNVENELDDNKAKEDEDEMVLLCKKLQIILREKRNNEKRIPVPQRKIQNKNE